MARFTPFLGDLSGKMKGLVFAFNKAGSYVRGFRMPTDPKTGAQLNNRATFAEASTTWHSLTDAQKAAWNAFAITFFKPKMGSSGTRFSGFNAYVSLSNVVGNMNRQKGTPTFSDPSGLTGTFDEFYYGSDAPVHPLSAQIQDNAGAPISLILTDVTLNGAVGSSVVSFNLVGTTGPGPISSAPKFLDAIGDVPVGIGIVASLAIEQSQQFVHNPNLNLVAVVPPIDTLTGWASSNSISIDCPKVTDYDLRKLGYQTGNLVQFQAYLIGQNGMTQPLNGCKSVVI